MNGYTVMAESYKKAVEQGKLRKMLLVFMNELRFVFDEKTAKEVCEE